MTTVEMRDDEELLHRHHDQNESSIIVGQFEDSPVDIQVRFDDLETASITKIPSEIIPVRSMTPTEKALDEVDSPIESFDKRSVASDSPSLSRVGGSCELSVRDLPDRPPSAPNYLSINMIDESPPPPPPLVDTELDLNLAPSSSLSESNPESVTRNLQFGDENDLTTPSGLKTSDEESLESTLAVIQSPPLHALSYLSEESPIGLQTMPIASGVPLPSSLLHQTRMMEIDKANAQSNIEESVTRVVRNSTRVTVEQKQNEERRGMDSSDKPDIKGSVILAGIFTGIAAIIGTIFSRRNEI
eukprot:g8253.t1